MIRGAQHLATFQEYDSRCLYMILGVYTVDYVWKWARPGLGIPGQVGIKAIGSARLHTTTDERRSFDYPVVPRTNR